MSCEKRSKWINIFNELLIKTFNHSDVSSSTYQAKSFHCPLCLKMYITNAKTPPKHWRCVLIQRENSQCCARRGGAGLFHASKLWNRVRALSLWRAVCVTKNNYTDCLFNAVKCFSLSQVKLGQKVMGCDKAAFGRPYWTFCISMTLLTRFQKLKMDTGWADTPQTLSFMQTGWSSGQRIFLHCSSCYKKLKIVLKNPAWKSISTSRNISFWRRNWIFTWRLKSKWMIVQ